MFYINKRFSERGGAHSKPETDLASLSRIKMIKSPDHFDENFRSYKYMSIQSFHNINVLL